MKLMKRVPTADQMTAGLRVADEPGVRMAQDALANANSEHRRAQQRLREASDTVARLPRAVAAGTDPVSSLETALAAERTAALLVPQYADRVTAAERALNTATAAATRMLIAETERRRDTLQAIADEISPMLEALRVAEFALDEARAALDGKSVPALTWPQSVVDERSGMVLHHAVVGVVR